MFRANFQRTGVYNVAEACQLKGLKWQSQKLPEFSNRCLGLAVSEGIVCIASRDRNLYGLDSQTGQQLWKYPLKERIFSSPIVDNGTFYVDSIDYNGTTTNQYLRAIDARSGQLKWQFKLDFQVLSLISTSIPASPVIAQGVIYIGGTDGNLYGINIASEELVWSFKTTKNMPLTSPALQDDIICVASSDGYLYAIEISTRQQKWKYEIGNLNPFSLSFPAIANQAVYIVSGENTLYALNLQTGQLLWAFEGEDRFLYAPIITEKAVYISGFNTPFSALDIETGKILRSFPIYNFRNCSHPIIVGNTVLVGGQSFLRALSLDTEKEIWRFTTPFPENLISKIKFWIKKLALQILTKLTGGFSKTEQFSTPIVNRSVIYVVCKNGYIYALC